MLVVRNADSNRTNRIRLVTKRTTFARHSLEYKRCHQIVHRIVWLLQGGNSGTSAQAQAQAQAQAHYAVTLVNKFYPPRSNIFTFNLNLGSSQDWATARAIRNLLRLRYGYKWLPRLEYRFVQSASEAASLSLQLFDACAVDMATNCRNVAMIFLTKGKIQHLHINLRDTIARLIWQTRTDPIWVSCSNNNGEEVPAPVERSKRNRFNPKEDDMEWQPLDDEAEQDEAEEEEDSD
jgi:hypothetical protein